MECFVSYLDSFVFVLINNILVYPNNEGEHIDNLRLVLQLLKEHQLFAKYRKCEFWLRLVVCLVHIISSEGVEVYRKKTKVVKTCPRLLNPTDISSFLV